MRLRKDAQGVGHEFAYIQEHLDDLTLYLGFLLAQ